jgi:hypothetical protein
MPQLPPLRFLPVSERAFTAYLLTAGGPGQTVTVVTAGGETVMVLQTPAGPITARRAK